MFIENCLNIWGMTVSNRVERKHKNIDVITSNKKIFYKSKRLYDFDLIFVFFLCIFEAKSKDTSLSSSKDLLKKIN